LVHLAVALGVWEALKVIKLHRQRNGIPDHLVLHTLRVLPFV